MTTSHGHVVKKTEARLDDQGFDTTLETIGQNVAEKAMDVELIRDDRHREFIEPDCSKGALSASWRNRPPRDSSDERTDMKLYSEISEDPAPQFLPRNEVLTGHKLKLYPLKPKNELDVPSISVVEPINILLAYALDYLNYRLRKNESRYDGKVEHEWYKMAKKIAL